MSRFYDLIDTMFIVEAGKIESKGEDSFCCSMSGETSFTAVFDGSGGMGFRQCPGIGNKTEAYLASRFASGAVYDWYSDHGSSPFKSDDDLLRSLDGYIRSEMKFGDKYNKRNLKIGGSLVRDFPTTIAMSYIEMRGGSIILHVIWAGDSRVYLIDGRGLAQLSVDDVYMTDAFDNLSDDGAMTNVLSSDGNFVLHHKTIKLSEPATVITATDGCFGYIPSPMEFEYLLLDCFMKSGSIDDYKFRLKEAIGEVTGDDFALGFTAINYGSFAKMRSMYENRLQYLTSAYISKIDENNRRELWNGYKQEYERYFA